MAFREVPVYEIREVLRLRLGGEGYRSIARLTGVDRKTVRRYVEAAVAAGMDRERRCRAALRRADRCGLWVGAPGPSGRSRGGVGGVGAA